MPNSSSFRLRGRAACVAALALLGCSAPLAAAAPAQTTPAATAASADTPRISNGNIRSVPAAGNLAAQFKALVDQQIEPGWIAYTQPVIDSEQVGCCYGGRGGIYIDGDSNNCCGMCRLEDRPGGKADSTNEPGSGSTLGSLRTGATASSAEASSSATISPSRWWSVTGVNVAMAQVASRRPTRDPRKVRNRMARAAADAGASNRAEAGS